MLFYTALSHRQNQNGQALLIVVLVMVVALTVGLSLALQTATNLRTSTEEENSQRAFSAAEAGIERVLRTGVGIADERSLGNSSNIKKVEVTDIKGTEVLLNGGNSVNKDDGVDVWLVAHNASGSADYTTPWSGNLTVNWGRSAGDCSNAALELIVISGASVASATSTRYAIDPCPARRLANNFCPKAGGVCTTLTNPGDTVAGVSYSYKTTITVTSGYIVRIVPLYTGTSLAVAGDSILPLQGKRLDSVGESGDAVRKITFFQGYPRLSSELFQYAVFSPR